MSVFLSYVGLFNILFLGPTGNCSSPEDYDMGLLGGSLDPEDIEDKIKLTKRAGITSQFLKQGPTQLLTKANQILNNADC